MRIFLTGATGYFGSAIADRLLAAGHAVHGLARSDRAERALAARGVVPVRGDLRDVRVLGAAARAADGVIHAATTNGPDNPEADAAARRAILDALAGTDRPFVYTSSVWILGPSHGRVLDDDTSPDAHGHGAWRIPGEREVTEAAGVRGVVLRPAMGYGRGGCELVSWRVQEARELGVARTVGDGDNRWPLVHVDDVAAAYVAALERAPGGARLTLAASAPTQREIMALAARAAGVARVEAWPLADARAELGTLADALAMDQQVDVTRTRVLLGWEPRGADLATELASGDYG